MESAEQILLATFHFPHLIFGCAEKLLLRPTLGAEFCACFHFCAAVLAEFFGGEGLAALLTEFSSARFRAAVRTSRYDGLFEGVGGNVIHGVGFFLRIAYCRLHLNGGHLFLHVRRAIFAKRALVVPAIAIHPFATAFAFVEVRLGFLHGFGKSVIVRLFPSRRTDSARHVCGFPQHAAKEVARGI